jgi:hypothetical protein
MITNVRAFKLSGENVFRGDLAFIEECLEMHRDNSLFGDQILSIHIS